MPRKQFTQEERVKASKFVERRLATGVRHSKAQVGDALQAIEDRADTSFDPTGPPLRALIDAATMPLTLTDEEVIVVFASWLERKLATLEA
jgi:hypothetical protein